MTQNDLAGELSLDKSTASRVAASLDASVRATDRKPEDGRAWCFRRRGGAGAVARMEREDI